MLESLLPGAAADSFAALPFRAPDPGPITIMTQRIEPFIADALDAVPVAELPDLKVEGSLAAIGPAVEREIVGSGFGPVWLANWLAASAAFLARLYGELADAEQIRLRLETITDDSCERFHVDNVRLRLLCTYRGPGTEYLDPKSVAHASAKGAVPPAAVRHLDRGAVALIRGSRDPARSGLVHRSPPIAGTGAVRLLLVIDEAE